MVKKFIAAFILFLTLGSAIFFYYAFKYRETSRQARQKAKAPQNRITFLEGWSNRDIADYLEEAKVAPSSQFFKTLDSFDISSYEFLSKRTAHSPTALQGFLFPDTYFVPKTAPSGTSVSEIAIKKSLDNFKSKITPQMMEAAKNRNISLFEIVTLASIIEKETGRAADTEAERESLDRERKIIAGVFYNRLKINMALESDATINYVSGKRDPAPLLSDTKINSTYNTYQNPGLPPGPICNPSLSSIMAALYPEDSNYLYFLHDQKTGQAYYGRTYNEHLENKRKYLKNDN